MIKMEKFHFVKACGNGQSECAICCAFLHNSLTWDSMLYRISFDTPEGAVLSNTRYCFTHAQLLAEILNIYPLHMNDYGYVDCSFVDVPPTVHYTLVI